MPLVLQVFKVRLEQQVQVDLRVQPDHKDRRAHKDLQVRQVFRAM